jgi:hypothetical protein
MPADQPIELLVSRGRTTYAVEATYEGDFVPGTDEPPRRLTAEERDQVASASILLADALAGVPVEDELRLNDAIELLHRVSALTEGTPRFRLADGRQVQGDRMSYRAALS